MKLTLLIIGMILCLTGCAYNSHTRVTLKAKKAEAIVGTIPAGVDDGRVLLDRTMHLYFWQRCLPSHRKGGAK